MGKIKNLLRNKWVGFTLAALLYTLWFVVWTGNLWLLLGLPVIFDLYITKFFYRYVWSHNVKMCQRSKTYRTVYEWVNAITSRRSWRRWCISSSSRCTSSPPRRWSGRCSSATIST